MRTLHGLVLAALVGIGSAATSQATLIAYEPFDYATGNLTGNGGGTGFSGNWVTESGRITGTVVSPGASYTDGTNTLVVAGNRDYPAGAARNWRGLNSTVTVSSGSPIWMSFLGKANSTGSGHFGVAIFSGSGASGSGGTEIATLGKGATSGDTWGIYVATPGRSSVAATTASFLLFRFDGTSASLWVNPSLTSEAGLGAPSTTATLNGGSFNYIRASTSQAGNNGYIDEIRIGTTFRDVAPIPEPATAALVGFGGMLVLGVRRRAR